MLSRPALLNPLETGTTHTDLTVDVTLPTIEEIRMVIRQIKSEKAAQLENIPAEALVTHRSNCKHAPCSIQEDLEEEKVPPAD
ncbi:unnamed protein product [Schistosoma mattheei]|uniref:Uncharacterized protein n=1 Tax=Schistosoma mattheei TaxID=31246 RepID=A0A183PLY4_9TREM|nr:unnamed protein product [Schistosoma mattheei]